MRARSVVFVVPLVAWAGRPGFPFCLPGRWSPGGLIIGLGVRVGVFPGSCCQARQVRVGLAKDPKAGRTWGPG